MLILNIASIVRVTNMWFLSFVISEATVHPVGLQRIDTYKQCSVQFGMRQEPIF